MSYLMRNGPVEVAKGHKGKKQKQKNKNKKLCYGPTDLPSRVGRWGVFFFFFFFVAKMTKNENF